MNIRDQFAASLVDPENYVRFLSEEIKESIVGPKPELPQTSSGPKMLEYNKELLYWRLRLHAKIRYLHADAMLAERAR